MTIHFVPTEFLLSKHHWLSAEELTEQIVSPPIKAALESGGLLTTALQNAYRQPALVECRRQVQWTDAETVLGWRRDVLINVGKIPRVAAATLMPQNVLSRHPWLAAMGNNPLGEMLGKHARHQ
jgi:chorismate-pyruvate lyase